MKKLWYLLGLVCRSCPLCLFKRRHPQSRVSKVIATMESACPFCWGYRHWFMRTVQGHHQFYRKQLAQYKRHGIDIEAMRNSVIDRALPLEGEILEIGTGNGHLAIALAKRGFQLVSVDSSKEDLSNARSNAAYLGLESTIEFQLDDGNRLRFPDSWFDAIFMVNTLHHLDLPEVVFSEVMRVLRPDGKIIISDLTGSGFKIVEHIHREAGRNHPPPNHGIPLAREFFAQEGFQTDLYLEEFQEILIIKREPPPPAQ